MISLVMHTHIYIAPLQCNHSEALITPDKTVVLRWLQNIAVGLHDVGKMRTVAQLQRRYAIPNPDVVFH